MLIQEVYPKDLVEVLKHLIVTSRESFDFLHKELEEVTLPCKI